MQRVEISTDLVETLGSGVGWIGRSDTAQVALLARLLVAYRRLRDEGEEKGAALVLPEIRKSLSVLGLTPAAEHLLAVKEKK